MRKRYGDTNTVLSLSDKAWRCYSDTEPLDIFEEDNGTYTMTGVIEQTGLTADEVNEWLEDLEDEISKQEEG